VNVHEFSFQEFGLAGAVAAFAYLLFRLYVAAMRDQLADKEKQIEVWKQNSLKWEQRAVESWQHSHKAVELAKESVKIAEKKVGDGNG
jgi:electron transfer flavoprotein alpha/beta subunit